MDGAGSEVLPIARGARKPRRISAFVRKLPWNDRTGRFSFLKSATLILVTLPGVDMLHVMAAQAAGGRPYKELVGLTGRWAIYFLLLTMAVTPARRIFGFGRLILIRRMLGVAALVYTLLHIAAYVGDLDFDVGFAASETLSVFYLVVGLAATLGFLLLGLTSTDGMIRRMGALAWRRLHRIVIVIGAASFLHFYLAASIGAVPMSGLFLWLVGYRIMARLGWRDGLWPLLVLAGVAAVATALLEAAWLETVRPGIGRLALAADVTFSVGVRTPWRVLADGIAVALAAAAWRWVKGLGIWRAIGDRIADIPRRLAPNSRREKTPVRGG